MRAGVSTNQAQPDAITGDRSMAGFTVFAAAWAVYTLMHQALTYGSWFKFDDLDKLAFNTAPFVLAIVALGRPSSIARFVLLLVSIAVLKIWQLPYLGNHLFFTLCVTLTMLLAVGYRAVVRGAGNSGRSLAASSFDLFAPVVRIEIIALYFWVVVHKLNWDYLNPEVSCAWELYEGVVEFMKVRFGIPMPAWPWLAYPGIYGALLAEAVIPLLLAFRRTRKAGVFVGLLFHLMLSFHHNEYIASFSFMLYAVYVMFLPSSFWVGVVERWRAWSIGGWLTKRSWGMSGVVVAALLAYSVVIVALAAAGGGVSKASVIDTLHRYSDPVVFIVWLCYAGLAIGVFVRWRGSAWSASDHGWARVPMPAFYLLPLFVWLIGFSPYVGLKTHHAFAMFSNLRTEAGVTNHLFLPVSLRVVPYQDQPVRVIASNVVRRDFLALDVNKVGQEVTWFELRRELNKLKPGDAVTYQRRGEDPVTVKAEDVETIAELKPPPYWLRKTQLYKAVPDESKPCPCRH